MSPEGDVQPSFARCENKPANITAGKAALSSLIAFWPRRDRHLLLEVLFPAFSELHSAAVSSDRS
jgi:hypothetical protein